MKESQVSDQLIMRWVPVVDVQGRTHMEAVWITASSTQTQVSHAA